MTIYLRDISQGTAANRSRCCGIFNGHISLLQIYHRV